MQRVIGAEDKALQFQSLLLQINDRISSLEAIGLDMSKTRNKVERVKKQLEVDLEKYETSNVDSNNTFLAEQYSSAITSLNKIISELEGEKEDYYLISKRTDVIKDNLNNIDSIDVQGMFNEACVLLDKIEYSSTVYYEEESRIIEAAYEMIYNIMKLEAIYNSDDNSLLFTKVKYNSTHAAFITNLLRKEIAISGNEDLVRKQMHLEVNGMDSGVLIDKDLFRLVGMHSNEKYLGVLKENLIKMFKEYRELIQKIEDKSNELENDAKSYKDSDEERKENLAHLLKRCSVLAAGMLLSAILSISSFNFLEEGTREYPNTTTTYDLQTGEETVEEGTGAKDSDNVVVAEKEPWQQTEGFTKKYKQKTNYYKMPYQEGITDPSDYVEQISDLEPYDYETKTMKNMPEGANTEDVEYTVIMKEYSDEYTVGSYIPVILVSVLAFIVAMLIDILIYSYLFYENIVDDGIGLGDFLYSLSEFKDDKRRLYKDTEELKKMIKSAKKILTDLKANPSYILLADEVEKALEGGTNIENIEKALYNNPEIKSVLGGRSI